VRAAVESNARARTSREVIRISPSIPDSVLRQAKDKATTVTVRVGKDGITDSVIKELSDQLSNRDLVKVKANQGVANGSAERSEMFRLLAESTGSTMVHIRGNVAVFWSGKS